jgi:hypothetical protein
MVRRTQWKNRLSPIEVYFVHSMEAVERSAARAYFRPRGVIIRELGFAVARLEELFEEFKPAGERYGKDILQERAAPF